VEMPGVCVSVSTCLVCSSLIW